MVSEKSVLISRNLYDDKASLSQIGSFLTDTENMMIKSLSIDQSNLTNSVIFSYHQFHTILKPYFSLIVIFLLKLFFSLYCDYKFQE